MRVGGGGRVSGSMVCSSGCVAFVFFFLGAGLRIDPGDGLLGKDKQVD